MGRFSKLEPAQAPPKGEAPAHPSLATRPDPGALGTAGVDESIERTAGEWMALADQAFLRGDFKPALRWYSRAVDKESSLLEAWAAMIRLLLFRGDLGQAQTWNNRALTLFPNSGRMLALRAVVYARRGMLQQALNNSDAVLTQHAGDPVAHIARGEVLLLAENKSADFCFSQAVKMVPANDWRTPAVIGMIHEERRLWARAIQYYTLAAERNESSAVLWYRIASCRAEQGHTQSARRALNQARELCAEDDPLLIKLHHAETGSIWKRMLNLFRKK